jgi:hypothetical protein
MDERAFESSQRTDIFFFHDFHVGSEADPAFYSMIIGDSFFPDKEAGA